MIRTIRAIGSGTFTMTGRENNNEVIESHEGSCFPVVVDDNDCFLIHTSESECFSIKGNEYFDDEPEYAPEELDFGLSIDNMSKILCITMQGSIAYIVGRSSTYEGISDRFFLAKVQCDTSLSGGVTRVVYVIEKVFIGDKFTDHRDSYFKGIEVRSTDGSLSDINIKYGSGSASIHNNCYFYSNVTLEYNRMLGYGWYWDDETWVDATYSTDTCDCDQPYDVAYQATWLSFRSIFSGLADTSKVQNAVLIANPPVEGETNTFVIDWKLNDSIFVGSSHWTLNKVAVVPIDRTEFGTVRYHWTGQYYRCICGLNYPKEEFPPHSANLQAQYVRMREASSNFAVWDIDSDGEIGSMNIIDLNEITNEILHYSPPSGVIDYSISGSTLMMVDGTTIIKQKHVSQIV